MVSSISLNLHIGMVNVSSFLGINGRAEGSSIPMKQRRPPAAFSFVVKVTIGKHIGRGEEENAFHFFQAFQLVNAYKVEVRLFRKLDIQLVDVCFYLFLVLLVVLHFRDEYRHTVGHRCKSRVKAASAA